MAKKPIEINPEQESELNEIKERIQSLEGSIPKCPDGFDLVVDWFDWASKAKQFPNKNAGSFHNYIMEQMEKMQEAGYPVLSMILKHSDVQVRTSALKQLHENLHIFGASVQIKVKEGQGLPDNDCDGRPLIPEEKGNVIYCKIGNQTFGTTDGKDPVADNMVRHQVAAALRGNRRLSLYKTVKIGKKPVSLTLTQGCMVLMNYGYGIAANGIHANWFVEQLPPVVSD